MVVAALASWHDAHGVAARAVDDGARLIDHCAVESYSVMTRLPAPHRLAGDAVVAFLRAWFPDPWLKLKASEHRRFVLGLGASGVAGGAVHDALIAATAAAAGATLVSLDRRAVDTYRRCGVASRLLA